MPNLELSFANGEESLSVRRFKIREAISTPFQVDVIARSEREDLELQTFVNKAGALKLQPGVPGQPSRVWAGVVSSMEQLQAEDTGLSTYALRIVPTLWRTTLRRGNRIYQHLTTPEIVTQLLTEWDIEPELRIDPGAYPTHEYRVQYGETDFAFLSRLLEEAGIAYFFLHGEGQDGGMGQELSKLVLADEPQSNAPRLGGALPYADNPNEAFTPEYTTKVRLAQQVTPGRYTIRDFDFRNRPDYQLFADSESDSDNDENKYEQYHYLPGAFVVEPGQGGDTPVADDRGIARVNEAEARNLAQRSLDGERRDRRVVSFETNVVDIVPGTVFAIDHAQRRDLSASDKLLVKSSFAEGEVAQVESFRYGGEAVYADQRYRPPHVTPRPRIVGVQSAVVVGPRGEEIHTDEFGRVRVQFHWDREGTLDERSSCWIRVSQAWAGSSFGMMVIPRVGQEVLVDFFDGDPDRPIVTGRVYNNTTRVPYPLPENKTKSTWKSDSSPGSGGFNEIMFEDKKGSELFKVQAEKDRATVVKNDETLSVGNNRSSTIGSNDSLAVGENRSVTVGASHNTSVIDARSSTIGTSDTIDAGEMYQLQVAKSGTGMRVTDNRIVISTADACIILDHDSIHLEANGNIVMRAGQQIVLNAGAPIAIDGELVLLNCQGPDPQQVMSVGPAADPGGPGDPNAGETSQAAEILHVAPEAPQLPEGIVDVRVRPDVPVPDEMVTTPPTMPNMAPPELDLSPDVASILAGGAPSPEALASVLTQSAASLAGDGVAAAGLRILSRGPDNVMQIVQLAAGEAIASLPTTVGRVLGPVLEAATAGPPSAASLAPVLAQAFNGGERFAVVQPPAVPPGGGGEEQPIVAAVRTQSAPSYFDPEQMGRQATAFEAAGMAPVEAAGLAAAQQGVVLYEGGASGQLRRLPTQ